jgi:hypothetical protein
MRRDANGGLMERAIPLIVASTLKGRLAVRDAGGRLGVAERWR